MEKKHRETNRLDYQGLCDLARSRSSIRYVEAQGLDTRKGIRFHRDGGDWIAVDSDLSVDEKVRALGYLLGNEPAAFAGRIGIQTGHQGGSPTPVLTLCCS